MTLQKHPASCPLALWAVLVLSASVPLACGGHGADKSGASSGSGSAAPQAWDVDPPKEPDPITLQGGSLALMPDEGQVVIADEDHEVLFVAPTDLVSGGPKIVPMPGPPEQVVALEGLVFATVRTLPTDAARALHETIRGPVPSGESGHSLSPTKVAKGVIPMTAGEPSGLPSASARESATPQPSASNAPPHASARASASASASAAPKAAKPPPKRGTPPLSIDPGVVRQSQGGLLLAFRTDEQAGLVEIGRVVLAPDAWGLALTPDRKRAIVTSAWASEVSIIDVADPAAMKVVAHEKVSREPRGVAISSDGKTAFVSHIIGTAITRVDDVGGSPKISSQPLPAALARTIPGADPSASLGYALVLAPDSKTLYVPRHALGAEGIGSWWGAPTVDTLDVPSGKPLQPVRAAGSPTAVVETNGSVMRGPQWLAQPGVAPSPSAALISPRAAVYRSSTNTLLIASEGADDVVELGTGVPDPAMDVRAIFSLGDGYDVYGDYSARGGAPTGLALTRDEKALFVWCRSTFDLARIDLLSGRVSWYHVADDGLPIDAVYGRRLFFNARSTTISGGLACASCHPDGRDDAYVWREGVFNVDQERFVARREIMKVGAEALFADETKATLFPRQTPMLAGRVRADGPYGWHGNNKDLLDRLVEGFHLHRAAWDSAGASKDVGQDVAKIDYLADFIRSGLFPPPTLVHELDETEKKGKAIYEGSKANCMSCHLTDGGSDRKVVQLSPLPTRTGFDPEPDHGFKVPGLTFVGGTAPYFHDGSAASLEDLIKTNGQRMGDTSQLNADEQAALVAYLRTL